MDSASSPRRRRRRHLWWLVPVTAVIAAVGATAATVRATYADLDIAAPTPFPDSQPVVAAAPPHHGDSAALALALDQEVARLLPSLGTFSAAVIEPDTGAVVFAREDTAPRIPASATKMVTALGASLLDPNSTLSTTVVRTGEDTATVRAGGDIGLRPEQLDSLAQQLQGHGIAYLGIDTSIWTGPLTAPGWELSSIDEGFVAPIEPVMIAGGRLGGTTGDLPRSHNPAADMGEQLAQRIGAEFIGQLPAPAGAQPLAQVDSDPLALRAQQMVKFSDNVMAEAIGREIALARGYEPSFSGVAAALNEVLSEQGLAPAQLNDASGLSVDNRLDAQTLARISALATASGPAGDLAGWLPVAGGQGTLYERYSDADSRGWVRAKTGTLTGVSALVGTAMNPETGTSWAFAFVVNDGDILPARAALDELATVLTRF